MRYVGVSENQRLARYDFDEYVKEHGSNIKSINRHFMTIILNNDDSVTFISKTIYDKWCMGRTYKILGDEDTLYHSGYKVTLHVDWANAPDFVTNKKLIVKKGK